MPRNMVVVTDSKLLDRELNITLEDAMMDYKQSHNNELPTELTIADALLSNEILQKGYIEIDGLKIRLNIFHLPVKTYYIRD